MTPNPSPAPDWLTIEAFLQEYALPNRFSAFPIESFDGGLAGLATLQRIKRVPPKERSAVRVRDVACPMEQVPTARPDEPLVQLLQRMPGRADGRALVLEGDHLVGIVTPTDVARALELAALGGTNEAGGSV